MKTSRRQGKRRFFARASRLLFPFGSTWKSHWRPKLKCEPSDNNLIKDILDRSTLCGVAKTEPANSNGAIRTGEKLRTLVCTCSMYPSHSDQQIHSSTAKQYGVGLLLPGTRYYVSSKLPLQHLLTFSLISEINI
mmetsp:Transcript_25124/g.58429  ORF Transcript_25124/g.58429 Transcript_25124/m.58429 type:complete len:135 (-) Transcript_25124:380-784(-)